MTFILNTLPTFKVAELSFSQYTFEVLSYFMNSICISCFICYVGALLRLELEDDDALRWDCLHPYKLSARCMQAMEHFQENAVLPTSSRNTSRNEQFLLDMFALHVYVHFYTTMYAHSTLEYARRSLEYSADLVQQDDMCYGTFVFKFILGLYSIFCKGTLAEGSVAERSKLPLNIIPCIFPFNLDVGL